MSGVIDDCVYAAVRSIPDVEIMYANDGYAMGRVSPDWYVALGPDDGRDTEWLVWMLPPGEWSAVFESFGQTAVIHFLR